MSFLEIEAVDAADEILLSVFGLSPLEKAGGSVLHPKGFDDVVLKVFREIKKATAPTEAAGLHDAIQLLDRQWAGLSPEKREAAIDEMAAKWLKVSRDTGPIVSAVLKKQGPAIVVATKQATADEHGLAIHPSFDLPDEKAAYFLAMSQAHYVTNKMGQRVEEAANIARKIVSDGLLGGLDKYDIGKQLSAALSDKVDRTDSYWRMLASVYVARARTYSQLSGYADAGISAYQWESVLDAVTSQHCRFMHGRVFPVANGLGKMSDVEEADDPESVKTTLPWMSMGKTPNGDAALFYKQADGSRQMVCRIAEPGVGDNGIGKYTHAMNNQQLLAAGICMPPAHAHCRSITIPVFGHARGQPYPPEHPAPPPPPPRLAPSQNVPFKPVEPFPNANLVRPLPSGDFETAGELEAPKPKTEKEYALDALDALDALPVVDTYNGGTSKIAKSPLQAWPQKPNGAKEIPFDMPKTITLTNAAKKPLEVVPVSQIVASSTNPSLFKPDMKKAIETGDMNYIASPSYLAKPLVLVKHGQNYYIVEGSEKIMSPWTAQKLAELHHLNGEKNIAAHVVDVDALAAKPPPKPKKPKAVPVAAPVPPPVSSVASPTAPAAPAKPFEPPKPLENPPPLGADVIMGKRVGEAAGSNKGGFYVGTDGVKRYVKFYDDPSQAFCEHLANNIYRDLGVAAPVSHVFEHEGKIVYASDIFEGATELGRMGVNEKRAKQFLDGVGADVLTANWDAVGTGKNNAMVLANGEIARIDQGGTFVFRAQAGRKKEELLNKITETDVFFSSTNPHYFDVAKAAGVSSLEDMKEAFTNQVKAIEALHAKNGNDWGEYVADKLYSLPGSIHSKIRVDAPRIEEMLEERTKLLREKVTQLNLPTPAARVFAPGEARFLAKQYSTTLPRAGLTLADLPEHDVIADHYGKFSTDGDNKKAKMPSGETYGDYEKRIAASIGYSRSKVPADMNNAVRSFKGADYGDIRDGEERGKPDWRSEKIQQFCKQFAPEPGTVWRGIHIGDEKVAAKFVERHLTGGTIFTLGRNDAPATSSTSWNPNVSIDSFMGGAHDPYQGVKVLYKIHGKTQVPIEAFGECELLMRRDAKFRVTGLSRPRGRKKILVIECEEILEGEAGG